MNRIRFILFLSGLMAFSSISDAQKFTLGVKGGLNFTSFTEYKGGTTPMNEGYNSRLTNNISVYGEYHFNNLLSLSLGVEYSGQGGQRSGWQPFSLFEAGYILFLKYDAQWTSSYNSNLTSEYCYANFKRIIDIKYFLFPLLARVNFQLGKKLPFSIYGVVGPFIGFLHSANQITRGSSNIYIDAAGTTELTYNGSPVGTISFDNLLNEDLASKANSLKLNAFNYGIEGFVGLSYRFFSAHSVFIEVGGNFGFIPLQKANGYGCNNIGTKTLNVGYAYTF